jgi:hypothetical protein
MFKPVAAQAFTAGVSDVQHRLDAAAAETDEARQLRTQADRLREEGQL